MSMILDYYIIVCTLLTWIGLSAWATCSIRKTWRILFYTVGKGRITLLGTAYHPRISSDSGDGDSLSFKYKYEFKVNGRRFKGSNQDRPFYKSKITKRVRDMLFPKNMKVGDELKVFYDPEDPKENSPSRFVVVGGFIGLACSQLFLALAIKMYGEL